MSFDTWVMYLLAVIAICLTPGPNILLAMSHSVEHGLKRTSVTVLGCITATSTMALLSASGLSAILLASETAFLILKWAGGAYLIYLGVSLWFKKNQAPMLDTGSLKETVTPLRHLYAKGLVVSASNPKALVFFGALFPVFIDPSQDLTVQFAIMLTTFLIFSYGLIMFYAAITAKLAPYMKRPSFTKTFNRITGTLFIGMGIALATKD